MFDSPETTCYGGGKEYVRVSKAPWLLAASVESYRLISMFLSLTKKQGSPIKHANTIPYTMTYQ